MRRAECRSRLRPLWLALGIGATIGATTGASAQTTPPAAIELPSVLRFGDYAVNAAVARIVVEVDRDGVPADGQTPVGVRVRLYDRNGLPLATPALITVEHSGGRLLLSGARTDEWGPGRRDADRATPGVQIKVEHGVAEFKLLAPAQAQDVNLRVTAGAQEVAGLIHYRPERRSLIAAGLVEGVIDFRRGPAPATSDGFDQAITAWQRQFGGGKSDIGARTAFYVKGPVADDLLLTAAFDSDKPGPTQLLRDMPPDAFYPVLGDASLRSFDAQSASRLYLRLDAGRDYLMFGDFTTGTVPSAPPGPGLLATLKPSVLGNYTRTATGLRAHAESERYSASAFAFEDTLHRVVDEFASQGSGPYGLSNSAAVFGGETVEVIVRDRAQPSRVIATRTLQRLVDYSFEPFSGRILLASFLPAVDENLNPVSLRVSYEVDQGGAKFWVGGVDGQWRVAPFLAVGGSAITDRDPLAPYDLDSVNATLHLGPGTALVAEYARSRSTVNTGVIDAAATPALAGLAGDIRGQAWRVEAVHQQERVQVQVYAGHADATFVNPAAALASGHDEARAKFDFKIAPDLTAYGLYIGSDDGANGGGRREGAAAGLRWQATERLSLDAGLRADRETVGTTGTGLLTTPFGATAGLTSGIGSGSGGGALGFGNQPVDPVTGLPVISAGHSLANAITGLPAGTRLASDSAHLGAGYRITQRFTLGAEIDQDISGDARQRASLGGDYQLTERSRLYGRYEHQSGWVDLQGATASGTSANAFVFGVNSTFLRDTQAYSEYRLRDAISQRDLQLASGIRNSWNLAEGLRLATGLEHVQVVSGLTPTADAATAGLDYTADPLWKASTKLEFRRSGTTPGAATDDAFDTTLLQLMVARKLARDWTLLARDYRLATHYATRGGVLQDRAQLGIAYRDTDTNRLDALLRIEHKLESDASNPAVGTLRTDAWIASTHADVHPSRPWWFTGRLAAKSERDQFEGGARSAFRAVLAAGRGVYDLSENWDVGALVASQFGQQGARQTAVGAEVGYLLAQNLWLSVGVNVSGFHGDADLSGYEYTQRGAYVRLRFKFDEHLLRGRDPAVNRTLDR
ncbi:MAG: hypothetical protein KGN16_06000 [Burkholderiales bacterium]|nr:hypothetical protein [Burkholderiales bacterium]